MDRRPSPKGKEEGALCFGGRSSFPRQRGAHKVASRASCEQVGSSAAREPATTCCSFRPTYAWQLGTKGQLLNLRAGESLVRGGHTGRATVVLPRAGGNPGRLLLPFLWLPLPRAPEAGKRLPLAAAAPLSFAAHPLTLGSRFE